jgi:hypothetical protein
MHSGCMISDGDCMKMGALGQVCFVMPLHGSSEFLDTGARSAAIQNNEEYDTPSFCSGMLLAYVPPDGTYERKYAEDRQPLATWLLVWQTVPETDGGKIVKPHFQVRIICSKFIRSGRATAFRERDRPK